MGFLSMLGGCSGGSALAPIARAMRDMKVLDASMAIRHEAVWGPGRSLACLAFLALIFPVHAMAAGSQTRHNSHTANGQALTKARPDRPNSRATHNKLDYETARRR